MREATPSIRGALLAKQAGADILAASGCDEGGFCHAKLRKTHFPASRLLTAYGGHTAGGSIRAPVPLAV